MNACNACGLGRAHATIDLHVTADDLTGECGGLDAREDLDLCRDCIGKLVDGREVSVRLDIEDHP